MANTVNIAQLDIDLNPLIKSTQEVGQAIDQIKKKQDELKKSGETLSAEYIQNQADLKSLTSAYNANIKAIADSTQAQANQANRIDLINLALAQEATSIKEAREQNSLLNKLRNEANLTTEEGRNELIKLNAKLDENNNFIKENADQYLKQKINIGNYSESVIEAFSELEKNKQALEDQKTALIELQKEQDRGSDEWNYYNTQINQTNNQINILVTSMGGLNDEANATSTTAKLLRLDFKGLAQDAQGVGGAGNLLKSSLKGATTGMLEMVKASLAFIATPVGAIVAALVLAFALVKNAMDRSEESTNKITKVFSVFGGIVNKLLSFLEPLGEFLIDGIVAGFELAGKAAETALNVISGGLSLLGFDDAAKGVSEFSAEMKEAVKDAQRLADAEAELEKQQRLSQRIQLDYQRVAEKLRQTRDDESLSINERIKANTELGVVLQKQLAEELKIAQLALEVANLRIEAEGSTKQTLDQQAEALNTISDIQERITGQESEQLANLNSLRKESADAERERQEKLAQRRQKILDDALAKSQAELDVFISSQGIKAKSLQEELSFIEKVAQKKFEINEKEFQASEKTAIDKLNRQNADNEVKNELLKGQTDLVIANAQRELSQFELNNKTKIDQNKFLTEQLVAEEKIRLDLIRKEQEDFEAVRLANGVINQQQYLDAIRTIDDEDKEQREELRIAEETATNEKRVLDLENLLAQNQTNFDNELALKIQRLDLQKQAELKAAEKTGADKNIILKKYSDAEVSLRNAVEQSKLSLTSQGLAGAKELFKENTVAYKALAVAEASINTYKAASLALSTYAYPVGGIFAGLAIAQGLLNVSKIVGVKFEKGGIQEVGGKRHAQGGTKFYGEDGTMFEAEQGEGIGVLNRGAFGAFMNFNNKYGGGSSAPNFMEGGGIITQGVRAPSLDIRELANITITAIESMPRPVVAVEAINTGQSNLVEVVNGANF